MLFRLRVTSINGGISNDTVQIHVNDSINESPIADAGSDRTQFEHSPFLLDASKSWDPNGSQLTYHWRLLSTLDFRNGVEENISMISSNSPFPQVTASVFKDRDLVFELTVADPQASTATDLVTVHVQALPMSVVSAEPMHGSPGSMVTIIGSDLLSVNAVTFNGYAGTITPQSENVIRVRVPNGSRVRRPGGAFLSFHKAGLFDVWEYPEVTTGPLMVTDGQQSWTAPQPFAVSHIEMTDVILSQGMDRYGLVQGKDSLLQLQVRTRETGASNAALSTAICHVFTNTISATPVLEITNTGHCLLTFLCCCAPPYEHSDTELMEDG